MANSGPQRAVEKWIRTEWLPQQYGQEFLSINYPLVTKGTFKFDAVSKDRSIIACISTSRAMTPTAAQRVVVSSQKYGQTR